MKKFLSLVLVALMVFSCVAVLSACGDKDTEQTPNNDTAVDTGADTGADTNEGTDALKDVKVGFIFLHDEKSTYDKNFIDAAKAAQAALGLSDDQVLLKTNVPEGNECYEAACEFAEMGCDVIFADSFGHEDFMIKAAKEYPNVEFCHATGTKAHTEGLDNYHNAFADIYEGRYLAGIAAGLKLNEMIEAGEFTAEEAKIGYVGAFTYAEVISGYTSFFLGARSVCPTATMAVQFTGSWFDVDGEGQAARALIDAGCKVLSQHADSMGAPSACEENNIPNICYNGTTVDACPNTYVIASKINWEPYFAYMINQTANGEAIAADWCAGIDEGAVELLPLGEKAVAAGTAEAIEAAKAEIIAGTRHVFDTSTFTVGGETLTSYLADVNTDAGFEPDTEVIADGYFHESEFRSAPCFDLRIDGIELLNEKY